MLIFGWGHQKVKDLGPVTKHNCEHCGNEELWTLHHISKWFTLFFIPIFPYDNKYILACPICTSGFEVDSDKFKKLKEIAENNTALLQGKITEAEYEEKNRKIEQESYEE